MYELVFEYVCVERINRERERETHTNTHTHTPTNNIYIQYIEMKLIMMVSGGHKIGRHKP